VIRYSVTGHRSVQVQISLITEIVTEADMGPSSMYGHGHLGLEPNSGRTVNMSRFKYAILKMNAPMRVFLRSTRSSPVNIQLRHTRACILCEGQPHALTSARWIGILSVYDDLRYPIRAGCTTITARLSLWSQHNQHISVTGLADISYDLLCFSLKCRFACAPRG
jgi:hypothetical protein